MRTIINIASNIQILDIHIPPWTLLGIRELYMYILYILHSPLYISAENYIDGKELLELTASEIKDIVPPIGIAKKIIRLQPKVFCISENLIG